MPRGDKDKYTDKQKRKAEHIEESYESRGIPEDEAERRAWATVNKESGGGNKSGSGRGKPDTHVSAEKGGRRGGAASANRPGATGAVQGSVSFDESGFLDDTAGFAFQRWSVGVDPGVHFYFAGRAPEGFWVGPHAELSVSHVASSNESMTPDGPMTTTGGWRTLLFGGSARVGYTTTLSPGLSLQVAAGLYVLRGLTTNFTPVRDGLEQAPLELARRDWYVGPRMTLGVGWAL